MTQNWVQDNRLYIGELAKMERIVVQALVDFPKWLSSNDEAGLRWALSLARVSKVRVDSKTVEIGHATDGYRQELFELLSPFIKNDVIQDRPGLASQISTIRSWAQTERKELLDLYRDKLSAEALEEAVCRRPLALALSGGGGTSYIFLGALAALEEAGISPAIVTGTSMGALIGLYRASRQRFDVEHFRQIFSLLTWDNLIKSMPMGSRFCIPSTFRLCLREIFASEFQVEGRPIRIGELPIPFRASVTGLAHIDGEPDLDLSAYEHLNIRQQDRGLIRALLDITKKPLRSLYIGHDDNTREFNAIDAAGFSAAIPGLFQYDLEKDDTRMEQLVTDMMHRYGVVRLFDGGFTDNLPVAEARCAVQDGGAWGFDPFMLALDSFAPTVNRHWLFLPLMHVAAERTEEGKRAADLTIAYKRVLSPLNIVPSPRELDRVIIHGREETAPCIEFLKKMLSPIATSAS